MNHLFMVEQARYVTIQTKGFSVIRLISVNVSAGVRNKKSETLAPALTLFVDPPGLEPGLCGTKIRRVANYTMGQYNYNRRCKTIKKIRVI